jgi:dienelactone hydrolase
LEVEVLRSWQEDPGVTIEALRYTGERVDDKRVRVFAYRGYPIEGGNLPAVLHVHGGGQTASLDWIRFWTKRGYACISIDFCGDLPGRTDFTDWGPIPQGNMAQAGGGFQFQPTPRASSWFHWALVCRRALTMLENDPRVDPARLGVFGISVGGTLTWLIAGSDPRVKAAVPIYGCGYNYDRRNALWDLLIPSDDFNTWQRVISPEAHAPGIVCPVLFLSSTNDGHGIIDWSYAALGAISNKTQFQAFSARCDHHVEPREGKNLALWMDWHLKGGEPFPPSPSLRIALDVRGVPTAFIDLKSDAEVAEVEVFHALGDKRPQVRFWRSTQAVREQNGWSAPVQVMDSWEDLHVFANVVYKNGVCLSTNLRHEIPGQLGRAQSTLVWSAEIDQGPDGLRHWRYLGGYTDPCVEWEHLELSRDDETGDFLTFQKHLGEVAPFQVYTHVVGDPQFRGRAGWSLALKVRGEFEDEGLTLTAIEQDRSIHARSYSTRIPSEQIGTAWHHLVMVPGQFIDANGEPLRDWSVVDKIETHGRARRAGLSGMRWLRDGSRTPDQPKSDCR